MSEQIFSSELQEESKKFFKEFKNEMQAKYGHVYKDLPFFIFFQNMVSTLVKETLDIVYGDKQPDDELQSRTLKSFGGIVEEKLMPLLMQIKIFGQNNNIAQDELPGYSYQYCVSAVSELIPPEALNQIPTGAPAKQEISEERKLHNKYHVLNLVNLAQADGTFDKGEKDFLYKKAEKLGVDINEVELEMKNPTDIESHIPTDSFRKIEYFVDLVLMMVADREIDAKEEEFIMKVGQLYGFHSTQVKKSLDIFQTCIKNNREPITGVPDVIRMLKDRAKI